MLLALSIFFELVQPTMSWALTGGPAQPEFNSFTPVGTSDMVDLSSGDMSYNIPLMDVGGYPLNLAYTAGVGMDQEASWVGLGWNLSVGQINRNVRGLPDDFNGADRYNSNGDVIEEGDRMTYENYMKPNLTVASTFKLTPGILGIDINGNEGGASVGVSVQYNNYTGYTIKQSAGVNLDIGSNASVGFNAESGPDGLTVSPNLSLHYKKSKENSWNNNITASAGVSMNSRQGLTSMTLNASKKITTQTATKGKNSRDLHHSASIGSTINFADPLYTPTKRVGMTTRSFTGTFTVGGLAFLGTESQILINGYGNLMSVSDDELNKRVPAFGYSNTERALTDGVKDFNREKDGAVSVNTTNLPITNYTYDIYSVQGQGVSGMYRPFRNQVGYVNDPRVSDGSTSGNAGFEWGTGNTAHSAVNFGTTIVNSHSGVWSSGNYMLSHLSEGNPTSAEAPKYERVHYKNVGDLSADLDFNEMFDAKAAGYHAVRVAFNVDGPKYDRKALSKHKWKYNGEGNEYQTNVDSRNQRTQRQARNQTVFNLTKADLNNGIGYGPAVNRGGSVEYSLPAQAKSHHVNEVQIIRNDGARYVYGIPAYNMVKKEATFSVLESNGDCQTGLVTYNQSQVENPKTLPNDKFLDRTTTPAYAHTHLLTSILSTDYVDRENNGPTPDDFGSYTKFSYKKYGQINNAHGISGVDTYRWRVPFNDATYNEGFKTDDQDDKGNYVYGEKELLLIDKIETKTHVAIFHYSPRKDAHGVVGEQGGIDDDVNSYKLDKISLYSVKEYGQSNATPIKEVHFVHSYSLCRGVPNNIDNYPSMTSDPKQGGKLTLDRVYFTYRNSKMGKYSDYEFDYGYNPDYNIKGYDSWGNYLPNDVGCNDVDDLTASEYPFTNQDRTIQDQRAEAWCLKRIDLPSGGFINVEYESDDYAYVQDKETMRMFKVVGAGNSRNGSTELTNSSSADFIELYGGQVANTPKKYIYVEVDDDVNPTTSLNEIRKTYLKRIFDEPIYFRFLMNMTPLGYTNPTQGKFDYVTGYFEYQEANGAGTGYDGDAIIFQHNGKKYLSIPVRLRGKKNDNNPNANPMSLAAWHFGRKYLNRHVYSAQPNGATEDIGAIIQQLASPQLFNNLIELFAGPNATLENKNIGRVFNKHKSWIRLSHGKRNKLGGGCRVKSVRMNDVWEEMNPGQGNYQTMNYGQKYEYTIPGETVVDAFSSTPELLTSGVATYEPIGNKENPFVQPVFSTTKHLLAPDDENFVEKPFGEAFFPSPKVTYSRVTVSNLIAGTPVQGKELKRLHRTGSVVSEFYTAKDYPTIVDQTIMEGKQDKNDVLGSVLNLYTRKHFTATQGYVIHLNDMDGKQKAQWVYAEGQAAPISGVEYLYDNHQTPDNFSASDQPGRNKGKLNNEVVVIHPNGGVSKETIGVEMDMVHDLRENTTKSHVINVNMNIGSFVVGTFVPVVPMPIPSYSQYEDKFRSISTTKVINTFGIMKETIAHDAGASVSTRNLAWDARTGEVLLTETIDEFNDKYFTMNYPAHWYYDGMGQASQNIGFTGNMTSSTPGQFMYDNGGSSTFFASRVLLPGDELYLNTENKIGWVRSVNGNNLVIIDENGAPVTSSTGTSSFKVVRSGHRNLQSAGIMNVTLMKNPLLDGSGSIISSINDVFMEADGNSVDGWKQWRVINAGAVDYSDDWKVGCECGVNNTSGPYNEYRVNEKGVWRTKSSRTYLTGRNNANLTTPRQEGFFNGFAPMYQVATSPQDPDHPWVKDFTDWTFVAEVTEFSPYGFELENKDALERHSAAQYGYNNTFPMAVGANTHYHEIGFDGFEDYHFGGCPYSSHFKFDTGRISTQRAHTGKHSIALVAGERVTMTKKLDCPPDEEGNGSGGAASGSGENQ